MGTNFYAQRASRPDGEPPPPELISSIIDALEPERLAQSERQEGLRLAWLVLGDWLSARGDIRGEIITIDAGGWLTRLTRSLPSSVMTG